MHSQAFDITQHERDGSIVLRLAGELDVATAPRLKSAVDAACASGAEEVVLDLRSVRFIDSSGLRQILQARETCEEHSKQLLVIAELQAGPRRLFDVTGAGDVLRWRDAEQNPRLAAEDG
jgi:anti-sigma B factor antagonist